MNAIWESVMAICIIAGGMIGVAAGVGALVNISYGWLIPCIIVGILLAVFGLIVLLFVLSLGIVY